MATKRDFGERKLGAITMKTVFSALSIGLTLAMISTSASAVPFSYRFESQIVSALFEPFGTIGDPASITVTLDNGGSNDLSQVWTAAHLQSLTFDINNGAATASFFSPFDGGLVDSVGAFATDASGSLISAPSNWRDSSVTADFIASFPVNNELWWFISGINGVLFDSSGEPALLLADIEGITDPANWSRVTDLPLPPTLLLLLVGLGGAVLLRRTGPGAAGGLAEARGT